MVRHILGKAVALCVCYVLVVPPLQAGTSSARPATGTASFLEAAEIAAASGEYRAQNTSTITTGRIRPGDKKRSALAFALSGAMAFVGAGLWRWLPCRNVSASAVGSVEAGGYHKCYDENGERKGFDTPTKWLLGAGVGLEVVALGYLVAHLVSDGDDP